MTGIQISRLNEKSSQAKHQKVFNEFLSLSHQWNIYQWTMVEGKQTVPGPISVT